MKRRHFLIFTERMTPTSTATSLIAQRVMDELVRCGHLVSCIAVNQDEAVSSQIFGYPVYPVSSTRFAKRLKQKQSGTFTTKENLMFQGLNLSRKVGQLIQFEKFPDVDPQQSTQAFKMAMDIHQQTPVDVTLSFFRPFSTVSAAMKFKNAVPHVYSGVYFLDLLKNGSSIAGLPQSLYEKMRLRGEIRMLDTVDFFSTTPLAEAIYKDEPYVTYDAKLYFEEFPLWVDRAAAYQAVETPSTSRCRFVYAGTLFKSQRSPERMLKHLNYLGRFIPDVELHLYGGGDCRDMIEAFQSQANFKIVQHGAVPHEQILAAYQEADFVCNISNAPHLSHFLPSKVIELFTLGKPIVNFDTRHHEPLEAYLDQYPCLLKIYEDDTAIETTLRFQSFVQASKGKTCDEATLSEIFSAFTASRFVEQLMERYEKSL